MILVIWCCVEDAPKLVLEVLIAERVNMIEIKEIDDILKEINAEIKNKVLNKKTHAIILRTEVKK